MTWAARARASAALALTLAACAPGDDGGTTASNTAAEWLLGSEWEVLRPEWEAAMNEMRRMPPNEFGPFMRRNGWKERWPEMWGEDGAFSSPGLRRAFQPPEAATPSVLARLRKAADHAVQMGIWTRSEADEALARTTARHEEALFEHIERHAREWEAR